MGIGIGPQNWLTQLMHRWNREETPAEMPVIRKDDSEASRNWPSRDELVAEIDRLNRERESLWDVSQVNKHADHVTEQFRKRIKELESTIQQSRNILGLGLSPVNRLDLNNAWHNSQKKSIPSIPSDSEPL